MGKDTTRERAVEACAELVWPTLLATENWDDTEQAAREAAYGVFAEAMTLAVGRFDGALRSETPRGWRPLSRAWRTVKTSVGDVRYLRTRWLDEHGRNRWLADELLGMDKGARVSGEYLRLLAERAAVASYREAASELAEAGGSRVSAATVGRAVREVGAELLDEHPSPGGRPVSIGAAFLEVDGVHAHIQAPTHRAKALPRREYEEGRRPPCREVKFAVCYAGKHREGSRTVRDRVDCLCSDGSPERFWAACAGMLAGSFELADLETLWVGTDGAGWCDPWPLEAEVAEVRRSLDPFHVLKKIVRAFPEGPGREWVKSLAYARRPRRIAAVVDRVLPAVRSEARRRRLRDLRSYVLNNEAAVLFPRPAPGTMEGANAHVGSKRLKGRGRSWSLAGMEAMGAPCCAVFCGGGSRRRASARSSRSESLPPGTRRCRPRRRRCRRAKASGARGTTRTRRRRSACRRDRGTLRSTGESFYAAASAGLGMPNGPWRQISVNLTRSEKSAQPHAWAQPSADGWTRHLAGKRILLTTKSCT